MRSSAAFFIPAGSGLTLSWMSDEGTIFISAMPSNAFAVNPTYTGPLGWLLASLNALRITLGICSAISSSTDHLVTGRTNSARSVLFSLIFRES